MSVDDWHKVLRVNLSGAFYMSKPALEHMVEQARGRIINISSIVGQMGNIGQANYAASKSGLFGLTMTMAREAAFALEKAGMLDDQGIGLTVNAVAPGFTETEMLATVPEKVLDRIRAQIPLRRPLPPGGDRARGALPRRRRLVLHHRPGVVGERRYGHVTQTATRVGNAPTQARLGSRFRRAIAQNANRRLRSRAYLHLDIAGQLRTFICLEDCLLSQR